MLEITVYSEKHPEAQNTFKGNDVMDIWKNALEYAISLAIDPVIGPKLKIDEFRYDLYINDDCISQLTYGYDTREPDGRAWYFASMEW